MIWPVVLPRTIESSTTTIRLPPTTSGSGLNFIRRPCLRSSWPGWMNAAAPRTGLDLAGQPGADDVEGAALRGHAVALPDLPQRQRPQPGAVAERKHALRAHHDRRERALEAGDHVLDRVSHGVRLVSRD